MIGRLQMWAAAVAVVVAALLASWLGGSKAGRANAKAEAEAAKARAARQARETENEVEALDIDALGRRAAKWVRDPKR